MIRNLAQCPYCKSCEIALDDRPAVVFNPDGSGQPCPHLAWVDCRYSQWELSPRGIPHVIGSTDLQWGGPPSADQGTEALIPFLKELSLQGVGWEFAPGTPFALETLSAEEKTTDAKGKTYTARDVDGSAIFAQSPAAFWAAVPECQQKQLAGLALGGGEPL
jgi:hypothetical protein